MLLKTLKAAWKLYLRCYEIKHLLVVNKLVMKEMRVFLQFLQGI